MTTPELSVADEKDRASADSRPAPVQSWPRLRFASFCYIQASTSALDWVLGPLFPSIQAHYGIVYRVAALLLITQFIGALLAFPLNFLLGARLGVARMTIVGAVLMLLGSVVACFDVPFAVLALAYACYSLGQVVTRVQTDSRAVSLVGTKSRVQINAQHASNVTMGGVTAAVGTAMISAGLRFQRFYIVGSGLLLLNLLVCLLAALLPAEVFEAHPADLNDALNPDGSRRTQFSQVIFDAARVPQLVPTLAFVVCYVGWELAIASWAPSWLIGVRGGPAESGYSVTALALGLAVGRIALLPATAWLGVWRGVWVYNLGGILLAGVAWAVKNVAADIVLVGLIGIAIAPVFPTVTDWTAKRSPRRLHVVLVGAFHICCQFGAAIWPFISGAVFDRWTVSAFMPLLFALMALTLALWLSLLPTALRERRLARAPLTNTA